MNLEAFKTPRHPFRSLSLYLQIFGLTGLYYAITGFLGREKKTVRVARKWGPQPIYLRLNSSDLNVFRQVFIEQEYRIIESIPGDIDTVIDAGANIGLTSLFIAIRHPNARIYAIEPEARNFELLKANTAAYDRIHCIKGALWHRDEPVEILSADVAEWAFRVGDRKPGSAGLIQGYRVRSLAAAHGENQISLFKMDIEGAEVEVLEDAKDWIDMVDNIVVELHERIRPGCEAAFARSTRGFVTRAVSTELTLVSRAATSPG